ncbi:enoyl-CoA hydratase/isomerase family protein [Streptomyces sp. NPDC006658]|uniref:enoyl-CoA hydratase/isomerase family protein n=1 Tax=Streptomyces sp. NPDC006658 TaxID=3156900 RepID=UPI0033C0F0D1
MVTPTTQVVPQRLTAATGAPTRELIGELRAAVDRVTAQPDGAALVLRVEEAPRTAAHLPDVQEWSRWEKELVRLERLPVPTVVLLDGEISGAALQLSLAADIRFATARTVLSITELADGYLPGMAIHRLVKQVGLGHARRMVLSGERLMAPQAERLGLLDSVVADPAQAAERLLATRSLALGTPTWHLARRLLLESHALSTEDALGSVLAAQERALRERTGQA